MEDTGQSSKKENSSCSEEGKKKENLNVGCMAGKERTKLTVCRIFREQCFSFSD